MTSRLFPADHDVTLISIWPWRRAYFQLIMTSRLFPADHDVTLISSWPWRHAYFQLTMTSRLFPADHDVTLIYSWSWRHAWPAARHAGDWADLHERGRWEGRRGPAQLCKWKCQVEKNGAVVPGSNPALFIQWKTLRTGRVTVYTQDREAKKQTECIRDHYRHGGKINDNW